MLINYAMKQIDSSERERDRHKERHKNLQILIKFNAIQLLNIKIHENQRAI
ncbi:hypothetical protein TTHERM_000129648 (macronuclear) [Tetrahymena thermophila SB210]|uniref:Uncharacterized protein n=1 Tax=Tetrahymena thermophila (strain SB210) TaxID=312017 RepID=W7XI45_TETTS|nr:hypothetical protein TTHERM_000129648 [Tetrahymena thermophila SB210]EWS74306.1 hypothetical protein TTHERM_000129648 [Tetrahymena thermophila SB210]|eukprot:XP_012653127.1 hypothetical protein TTHERM_000129648 [Tetrahymena thermophila SB210]